MSLFICPKCKYQTDKNDLFCCKCGTKMIPVQAKVLCKACGQKLSNNDQFCGRCGARQKPISWWVLVVILGVIVGCILSYYITYHIQKSTFEHILGNGTALV